MAEVVEAIQTFELRTAKVTPRNRPNRKGRCCLFDQIFQDLDRFEVGTSEQTD